MQRGIAKKLIYKLEWNSQIYSNNTWKKARKSEKKIWWDKLKWNIKMINLNPITIIKDTIGLTDKIGMKMAFINKSTVSVLNLLKLITAIVM